MFICDQRLGVQEEGGKSNRSKRHMPACCCCVKRWLACTTPQPPFADQGRTALTACNHHIKGGLKSRHVFTPAMLHHHCCISHTCTHAHMICQQ